VAATRCALITGAEGGIGRVLCSRMRDAGYHVVATDLNHKDCECDSFVAGDLAEVCAREGAREAFVASIEREIGSAELSVLVNNAAVQLLNRAEDITLEEWRRTLEVNLIAPFLLAQALLPALERAGGSIVNVASIHAELTKPGFICYATSKAALVGLTRSMAVDLGARVRVNAVVPAATSTPMVRAGFVGREESLEELGAMHPLGRIAEPDEVVLAVLFLASSEASFVSGACLHVDGGIGVRLHDPE